MGVYAAFYMVRQWAIYMLFCRIVKCVTEEDAHKAVSVINGTELEGRTLHVRLDRANIDSNGVILRNGHSFGILNTINLPCSRRLCLCRQSPVGRHG